MVGRNEIINILKAEKQALASEYGVSRIGLFGSFAHGTPSDSSDVDLVVEFVRPIGFRFMELAERLESLLGRSVDLLTPAGIKGIRSQRVLRSIGQGIIYV
jgi:hypothetical protein